MQRLYQTSTIHKKEIRMEIAIAVIALITGFFMTWHVYELGLTKSLTDASAHLNFSKMLFESMTPGVSQIGFWPPLLHILVAPFTGIDFLYDSGLAGALVLVPFLALGAVFLYKLCLLLTNSKWLSFIAGLLFIFNPYVLYYSSVAMMEVMFIANLFGAAYFLARWLSEPKIGNLIGTAVFVTLASLSRFEGLILIPLVSMIMMAQLIRKRRQFPEIQAVSILFLVPGAIGAVVLVVYSWVFGGDPLAFTGGSWIRGAETVFPTKNNLWESFRYVLVSSYEMLSQPLVILSLVAFILTLGLSRNRFRLLSVLTVLLSPVLFVILAIFSGTYTVAVPELYPFTAYLNERYGLSWIGFVIVTPIVLLGLIWMRSQANRVLKYAAVGTTTITAAALMIFAFNHFYVEAFQEGFIPIKYNSNAPRSNHKQTAEYLATNYDFGKVLIRRADNDPVLANSNIALNNYIYEGNYLFFDQTMEEPWMFARWVVMFNPQDLDDDWSRQNDMVYRQWGNSERFNEFYDLVFETNARRVYKVKDERVLEIARAENLNAAAIPSINASLSWWDPGKIYDEIQNNVASAELVKKN